MYIDEFTYELISDTFMEIFLKTLTVELHFNTNIHVLI